MTTSPDQRPTRRRLVLAGLIGAALLTGGAGAAYAASTDDPTVETGYAVVLDEDCPDGLGPDQGPSAEGTGVPIRVQDGGF